MKQTGSRRRRKMDNLQAGVIGVAALALIATPALAATSRSSDTPPDALDAVLKCRPIADPTAQLACYNAAASGLADLVTRKQAKLVDADTVRQTKRSLFGFTLPRVGLFAGDATQQIVEVDATIARVRQIDQTQIEIAMDDGAVWKTVEAPTWGAPKVGTKVHIKRALMGSYFLTFKGQPPVRGIRVG